MTEERSSDRWVSITLSVVLHGGLVAALVYGWWMFRQNTPPKPTLAIEATVVDAKSVKGANLPATPPAPAPPPPAPQPEPPPPVESSGPPPPTAEELAQRAQAQKEQEEKAQKEQQEKAEKEQQEKEQQAAEQQRQEDERKAAEQARARKAKEEAEAKKRAEEKRLAEQKRQDEERRKAAEAQQRAQTEAELRRGLEAEERQNAAQTAAQNAARNSAATASWESQIQARIKRAWLRPPTARQGIECELYVTQVPGGTVTNARVGSCNGDAAVRESIEAAAYRASPLPAPPDPSLFQGELVITFKPTD